MGYCIIIIICIDVHTNCTNQIFISQSVISDLRVRRYFYEEINLFQYLL